MHIFQRILYIGIGSGLINIGVYSLVGQTFTAKRSFANSLVTTTGPLLSFACAPLLNLSIGFFGWRWTMAMEGAVLLNMVPTSMIATHVFESLRTVEISNQAQSEGMT